MSQLAHERGPRPFKVVWHDTVQALDVWSCCHVTSRALAVQVAGHVHGAWLPAARHLSASGMTLYKHLVSGPSATPPHVR